MKNLIEEFVLENGIATKEEILEVKDLPDWLFPCGVQKVVMPEEVE